MRDIVLISFTPKDAGGGVPRWNRDFMAGFPNARHYSRDDLPASLVHAHPDAFEWDWAHTLGQWLHSTRRVKKDDLVIADGFWGERLSELGYQVVSVAHGIWSHLTMDDVHAGMQPEFPLHHAVQVKHRRDHLARGGKIVAVSDFVSAQMRLQWGFESEVINNGVDLQKFKPYRTDFVSSPRLVIHGVTTANKGFDHIEAVKRALPDDQVMLLDDAASHFQISKYTALARADLVVQPSAYEGNSYFVLETLASGVPIVAYDVGLLYTLSRVCRDNGVECMPGDVIDRKFRSPAETAKVTRWILESVSRHRSSYNPRQIAELFSIEKFHEQWRGYFQRQGLL